jgi:two-component system sensor histidine kinase/response regulator
MEKRKLTILVIDDNPADVEIVRRLLQQIDSWEIHFFASYDSKEGRAEVAKGKADLILLDYMLDSETGLEVLNAIKDEGCFLPVIMLTGHGNEEIAVEAMKAGVSDYLVKGRITPESLRLAISNALQKFQMQREIEEQRKALLDAERQRVMMESVGAACHHFAQPLTTMLNYLQMLAKGEGIEESQKSPMFEQCLKAAENMKVILNKFQEVREYRTRPYLAETQILDIGLESISGTPEAPKDKNRPQQGK